MILNSIYSYSAYATFLGAIVAIVFYLLRSAETKEKIHLFPYSVRKLFIEELKEVSEVTYDLFERRLMKNKNADGVAIALTGSVFLALIILGAVLIPSDLRIVLYYYTVNYYSIQYLIIDTIVLVYLLFFPIKSILRIDKLLLMRFLHILKETVGRSEGLEFDEGKNEWRLIRLYHYIKYFGFVSALSIVGFFIQLILVESTPYFYYQTNLAIALIPFVSFVILVILTFIFERLRLSLLYDVESNFVMGPGGLPGTHKRILLKTSDRGLFSGKPKICYFEGIGKKLKVLYKWQNEMFVSYVKWKDIVAFGFPDVKLLESIEKSFREKENFSDSPSNK